MSDTAAALSGPTKTVAAVVPHSWNFAITPWRLQLASLAKQVVSMIEENAEPEMQFRTAADISLDITNAVKTSLRQKYGRVFNPLIDGPEPRHVVIAVSGCTEPA